MSDFTTELCEGAGLQQGPYKINTGDDYLGSNCTYVGVVGPDGAYISHSLVTRTELGEEFVLLDTETGQGLNGIPSSEQRQHIGRLVGGVANVSKKAA